MAAFAEVYIDESGTHDGSPVMCVAGYLFHKSGATRFSREWGNRLKREELPYFHMVDCAHGNPPFDKKSKYERVEVEKALIARIHKDAVFGFSVSVVESEYDEIFGYYPEFGGAYSFCLRGCLSAISAWRRANHFGGEVAYFFESGHRDQPEANRIMNEIFLSADARKRFAYGSHAFVAKTKVVPLQAADLLGWLWRNNRIRIQDGVRVSRKDLVALVRPQDKTITYDKTLLREMDAMVKRQGAAASAAVTFPG